MSDPRPPAEKKRRGCLARVLRVAVIAALIVLIPSCGALRYLMHGPHRDYALDFVRVGDAAPGPLQAGFAAVDITPDPAVFETWTDFDGDARYNPDEGDFFVDRNGDGRFDAVWIGGFHMNRPAQGVNDPLGVRAVALRNNGVTVVLASVDSVGLFHDVVITARKRLDPALNIDHLVVSSTHTHQAPDTMGIWSNGILRRDYDKDYVARVCAAIAAAAESAVRDLGPVSLRCAAVDVPIDGFVRDSRMPHVYDNPLCAMQFTDPASGKTRATLVSWGNHPEAMGSRNLLLSSDFAHYLREAMEDGLPGPRSLDGFGGLCLYFQGNLGGLMTPLGVSTPDSRGDAVFEKDGIDKARALGENVARIAADALRAPDAFELADPAVAVAAKTFLVRFEGLYRCAVMLGLLHPGYYWGSRAKTEVNVVRIGDVEILTAPGELYPEIADGGVEAPEGRDFNIAPVETPPLRAERMQGRMRIMFNLANDEVGYIIPKSQWDVRAPFTYGRDRSPYGEENSGGPEIAPEYHRQAADLLRRMHEALPAVATP